MPGPGSFLVGEEEEAQILEVIRSGHLYRYGSPDDPRFLRKVMTLESEFAASVGVEHALAVNSGTAALWISMLSLGIGEGDEVIVPAYTYVATYTAVLFTGATPILAEVDETLNLDPNDVEARITPRTKAIVPVHMLGNPAELDALLPIAKKHDLLVIEDCAQAAGARYKGQSVGSFGRMGGFSLNFFKTFTAGDGGLIATNDSVLYEKAFGYHDQGHRPLRTGTEVGRREVLGMNHRINELTGAVALAQLRKLDGITSTLRGHKARLKAGIEARSEVEFRRITDLEGECGTLLVMMLENAERARRVAERLATTTLDKSGWHVYSNMEHIRKALKEKGHDISKGSFPRTDALLERSINLSVGVVDGGLGSGFGVNIKSSDEEIDEVAARVSSALAEA
ncbi:MAG: DegT/DnrJ/EryC1/StrS family aminotransferase [Myxococcota bacterium]